MGEYIELVASDGHRFKAYHSRPTGKKRGAVIVIQEVFGVDDFIKDVVHRYSEAGYWAISPALYDRQRRDFVATREEMEIARKLRTQFDWEKGTLDVDAARGAVAEDGKVGIVGYCFGGTVAWLACCALPLSAGVSYYGTSNHEFADRSSNCPFIMHFGTQDQNIPLERVDAIRQAQPDIPIHLYEAGHGFSNVSRPAFDAFSHDVALMRTAALFNENIG